jgi:hypothetical protein
VAETINDSDLEDNEIPATESFSGHFSFSGSSSSNSEEEISPMPEPIRGHKRTSRLEPKQPVPDFELEWSNRIETIWEHAFYDKVGKNEICEFGSLLGGFHDVLA